MKIVRNKNENLLLNEISFLDHLTKYLSIERKKIRLNIRYKNKEGKTEVLHTLNGTAIAIGRALIAICENYQQKDGTINVPEVLQKWTGFKEIK